MKALLATPAQKLFGLIFIVALTCLGIVCSVAFGVTSIKWRTIIETYTAFNGSTEQLIIQTARMPRALIAAVVGASLAIAGALMQAITRNPLASPSIFGINSGASLMIVISAAYFDVSSQSQFAWIAYAGAAISAALVYFLGSVGKGGQTPIKITLAGAALTAFFASLTQGVLLSSGKAMDQVMYWLVGSIAGRNLSVLYAVLPYTAIALLATFFIARHMNTLALGDDVAKGLGQNTIYVKAAAAVIIVILAGGSVAAAGPIAFVGIIIPHITRYLVGQDYRWQLPYCAFLGAILLLGADIGSRYIAMPKEIPVGVMTAIIGVPFLVYIARKGGGRG
ncbi:putative siderophore transport system permease protein YfiZ precursor [compost metagenome]